MRAPVPVPCRWPGGSIVCVGTGPSLAVSDLFALRQFPIIAINDACRAAPWADVIYAPDAKWWSWHAETVLPYRGDKYTLDRTVGEKYPSIGVLGYRSGGGLSDHPARVQTGGHSGFAAITLAAHLIGAGGRILLTGYDLQPAADGAQHFFGDHPDQSHVRYAQWVTMYESLLEPLREREITILNVSRQTAITAIPRAELSAVWTS